MNAVYDLNNLAFITRYAKLGKPKSRRQKEDKAELFIFVEMLKTILNTANKFGIDGIVIAADSKDVWRKDYYDEYKLSSDENDDFYYEETLYAADMIFSFFSEYTSACCLKVPRTEADDIIGIWCQESNTENIVISSDKDYIQLIDERNRVYSPPQKEFRTSTDREYELFLKCIRGEKGDNIKSAYPRIRETKLKKAWDDDLELLNLLEHVLPDGTKVGDIVRLNQTLIDLRSQPSYIRQSVIDQIENYQHGKYNQIKTYKYMNTHELGDFLRIFDHKDKALKNKPIFCNK